MRRVMCCAVGAALALVPIAANAEVPAPYKPMKVTALRAADGDPWDSVVTPNGKFLLAVGTESVRKVRITRSPAKVVGVSRTVFGTEIAVGRANGTAYVGNGNKVHVVATDRKVVRTKRTLRLPDDVTGIETSGQGTFLYVSFGSWAGPEGYGVRVYSLKKPRTPKKLVGRVTTAPIPHDVAVGWRGKRVITANMGSTLSIINTAKPRKPRVMRKALNLPFAVEKVAAAPGARFAYAWSGEYSRLAKIDLKKPRIVKIARFPQTSSGYFSDIDVTKGGGRVVVSREVVGDEQSVAVLRAKNLKKIVRFNRAPHIRTVAMSKAGKTKGRFYLGLVGDEFGNPPQPPMIAPVRPS